MSNTRIYIYNLYNCLQLGWDGGKKKFLVQSEGWTFSSVVESSQLMTINLLLIIRCVLDWKEHSFNLMRLNHLNGSVGKTLYSRFSWDNAQLSSCCSSCLLWIHAHYQLSTSGWLLNNDLVDPYQQGGHHVHRGQLLHILAGGSRGEVESENRHV